MPRTPGSRLGNYEIIALLGAGGMGEVYRARDLRLGREVALKVLPADVVADADRLARFEHEARTVAGLNHPNIVVLHSVEDAEGTRFLTMELVEGQGLDRVIVPGGLPVAHVLDLGIVLADALVAAHEKGVVHRDLKPANVMVSHQGRIKVLDFGLAKLTVPDPGSAAMPSATRAVPLSAEGRMAGTVPYMAPEQVRGGTVDARTDLFSLGVVLFELVTGRRPFGGPTLPDLASAILRDPPPDIASLRGDVPPDLVRIIGRCLEKDPERRLQTAKDVRTELELVRRAMASGVAATPGPGDAAARAEPGVPSIAVLPFENRGRDDEDEYFADGITEDVIAQLCKVRTLKVISRASVMPFKRHQGSLRDIAARLGVAHVLEGSVRRVGDRVRIVAQLVDPASGRNLWAETYDRNLTDIFGIQTEVALHIAQSLRAELTASEQERIRREPTRDVMAYELYLRGRQHLVRFNIADFRRSIEYFEQAIGRDPAFAPAHVGLAMSYGELAEHGAMDRDEARPRALAAAARAVALDPELGEAHCAQAYVRMVFELDWSGAEEGFKRAIELNPGGAFAYDLYGRLCAGLERYDEAIALQGRAHELDPLTERADLATTLLRAGRNEEAERVIRERLLLEPDDARLRATLGWALFRQGRVAEGLAELERATALRPHESMWLAQLGLAYGLAGETARARQVLEQLSDPARSPRPSTYHMAYVHIGLGDAERAMDCLEAAFDSGTGPVYSIKGSFLLAPLRQHPRFVALLKRMRLA